MDFSFEYFVIKMDRLWVCAEQEKIAIKSNVVHISFYIFVCKKRLKTRIESNRINWLYDGFIWWNDVCASRPLPIKVLSFLFSKKWGKKILICT